MVRNCGTLGAIDSTTVQLWSALAVVAVPVPAAAAPRANGAAMNAFAPHTLHPRDLKTLRFSFESHFIIISLLLHTLTTTFNAHFRVCHYFLA